MASLDVSDIAAQSAQLRAELKEWERAFAAANEGRKAERSDIKQAPEIAAKYKEYSRLKSLEKSVRYEKKHNPNSVNLEERPKKRKHASPPGSHEARLESTPRKAAKGPFTTPSKPRGHPSEFDPYDSPSALRRLFSPSTHQQSSSPLKTAIGPTPQRDGKALGLFDLLSESGGSTATPTAARLASVRGAAAQTPSKRKTLDTIAEEEEEEEDGPRGDRTPASASKSYMLSALFATPTTWRYATMMDNRNDAIRREPSPQPSANDAGQGAPESETPAFLRRSNSARYAVDPPSHSIRICQQTSLACLPKLVSHEIIVTHSQANLSCSRVRGEALVVIGSHIDDHKLPPNEPRRIQSWRDDPLVMSVNFFFLEYPGTFHSLLLFIQQATT